METSFAHCNYCGGGRRHELLHKEKDDWYDEDSDQVCYVRYEMLRCLGCRSFTMREASWPSFNGSDDEEYKYFPPAIFRKPPGWFLLLSFELPSEDQFIVPLLTEIYIAVQNNSPQLAAMGVRSLIEKIMISKVGDQKSFSENLNKFCDEGFISVFQKQIVEGILEVGHATIHRNFIPSNSDVITLIDFVEILIQMIYLQHSRVKQLKDRIPPRK